ncbi:TlpA disulfide reductase family protein [Kutzneria kofuensis]
MRGEGAAARRDRCVGGRRMKRTAIAAVLLIGLAACSTGKDAVDQGQGTFQFTAPGGQTHIDYTGQQRQPLKELSGDSLLDDGKQVKLSDYTGKIVVINIWGAWCGPCRTEAPQLQQVYDETKDQGVQVMGVDVRDDKSAALDFYHNAKLDYPSIFDPPGRSLLVLQGYPRTTTPSTLVLDRQHRVAWVSLLPVEKGELLAKVKQLLAEK